MLDFAAFPPEINSGLMYAGPGSGPMLAAAAAWDALAAELGIAASGYSSAISDLTSSPWVGEASASMVAAASPYVTWMSATAAQAEQAGMNARLAASAYETAFMMTVPPAVIAANRALLMALIATNFFGQNTPAIMVTEAHYMEMWAQDAAAMFGYAAASASASALNPFLEPPTTTNPGGVAGQAAAVAQAAATPAGNSASTVSGVSVASDLLSSLGFSLSSPLTLPSWETGPSGLIATIFGNSSNIWNSVTNYPYFALGSANSLLSFGGGLVPGAPAPSPALGGALPPPAALGAFRAPGAAVSASFGQASRVGSLSVPQSWASPTPAGVSPETARIGGGSLGVEAAPSSRPMGLLRGIPLTGKGQRNSYGYTNKYGFRYRVLTRTPAAG